MTGRQEYDRNMTGRQDDRQDDRQRILNEYMIDGREYRMRRNRNSRNVQLGPGKQTAKTRVWFGEIERKLAKLSKITFTYCSSS